MKETEKQKIASTKFWFVRLIRLALLIYLSLMVLAYLFSEHIIFQPPPPSYSKTAETITIDVGKNDTLAALYLENKSSAFTILYSHGTGEDLGYIRRQLKALKDHGFSVFAYDYRGYGQSSGPPSESNVYEDIDAAYTYMVAKLAIKPDRIIAYGRSLGTGVAVDLAVRRPLGGLILESPFVTAFRVRTVIPVFPFDKFTNIKKIKQVTCPVLIMHSRDDELVPFWHGRRLFERANPPKLNYWLDGAGHLGIPSSGKEYWNRIEEFVKLIIDI